MIKGIAPNTSPIDGIATQEHIRFGRLCHVLFVRRSPYQALRISTIAVQLTAEGGTGNEKLYRRLVQTNHFPYYVTYRRAETNSIQHPAQRVKELFKNLCLVCWTKLLKLLLLFEVISR